MCRPGSFCAAASCPANCHGRDQSGAILAEPFIRRLSGRVAQRAVGVYSASAQLTHFLAAYCEQSFRADKVIHVLAGFVGVHALYISPIQRL